MLDLAPPGDQARGAPAADAGALPLSAAERRHEVGNALAAASSYAQLLLRRLSPRADQRDRRALEGIVDSIARASHLLEGEAARPPGVCDLRVLLDRVAGQVSAERWPDIRVSGPADGPLVGPWDAGRLVQVFVNLLANAAKYSPAGAPIEVELSHLPAADWARVVVRDRGIGVEAKALEAIFAGQRTARARQVAEGSGIGLRLSRRLVEAEGGLLWAMNVPGGGSAFYVELPLARPDRAQAPPCPHAVAPPRAAGRATALVVEDDLWTRASVAELLEGAGYAVVQASNGHTGTRLASCVQPDLILLDLSLPECSGLALLDALGGSASTRAIPVVIVSAGVEALRPRDVARAAAVVRKPFREHELLACVERATRLRT